MTARKNSAALLSALLSVSRRKVPALFRKASLLRKAVALVLCLVVSGAMLPGGMGVDAHAQNRYGGGLQATGSTAAQGVGPALHFRTSFPMNRDFSLGLGGTLTGFIFGGENAYALDTEASLIVTLPNPSRRSFYVLGGVGYHVPMGRRYDVPSAVSGDLGVGQGPTFHVGLGSVWQLGSTSLYLEVTPALFFRRERSDALLPLRIGVIF